MIIPSLLQTVGWFAAIISVISLLPQLWKTWRSRSAHDLSLGWLGMTFFAAASWVAYGALLPAPEVMITNAVNAVLVLLLLTLKAMFRGKSEI